MRLFKTGEKRGKGRIKKLIALMIAGTMLAGSVSYAAGKLTVYYQIKGTKLEADNYTYQTGFCTDNAGNCYLARITKDDYSVRIFKLDKNENIQKLGEYKSNVVGHANDMTYCSRDKKIYICSKDGENKSNVVIKTLDINGGGLCKQSYNNDSLVGYIDGKEFICSPSGIAYDNDKDVFYLTQKKNRKYVVTVFKLNNGKSQLKNNGYSAVLDIDNFDKYVPQGITYNNKYLYVSLWEAKGTVDNQSYSGANNSLVVRFKVDYDKKSDNFKFTKESNNTIVLDQDTIEKETKFEVEGIGFVGKNNNLYYVVNADGKQGDTIYSDDYNYLKCVSNYLINEENYRKSKGKK